MRVPFAVLLPMLLLVACLDLEVEVTLAADGSGQQKVDLRISDRVAESLRQSARALDASGQRPDPMRAFEESQVRREMKARGLDVASYRAEHRRGQRTVAWSVDFPELTRLRGSGLFGGASEWYLLPGRIAGGARLVVYPQGYQRWRTARAQAEALRTRTDPVQQRVFERKRRSLTNLNVVFRLKLPGDVDYCSSNLRRAGTRTVECRVLARDLQAPADLVMALAPRFEVEFRATGCSLKLDPREPLQAEPGARSR